jgi:hypothetical protein
MISRGFSNIMFVLSAVGVMRIKVDWFIYVSASEL